MEALLGVPLFCVDYAAIFIGSAACLLYNSICPGTKISLTTKLLYFYMLVSAICLAFLMLNPDVLQKLVNSKWACEPVNGYAAFNCQYATGYQAIYRLCTSSCSIFVLMMLLLFCESYSNKYGSEFDVFGFLKVVLLFGFIFIGFIFIVFIGSKSYSSRKMYIDMLIAFGFILLQLILIVKLAHRLAEKWVEPSEDNDSRACYSGLCLATFGGFFLCLIAAGYVFFNYAIGDGCGLPKFFVIVNVFICAAISILSVSPMVQEVMSRSGLLQAVVISGYIIYLTWSALLSNPNESCNPTVSNVTQLTIPTGKKYEIYVTPMPPVHSFISLFIWIICLICPLIKISSNMSQRKIFVISEKAVQFDDVEKGKAYDNEEEDVAYSYSFFHFVLGLGILYVIMDKDLDHLNANMGSVWIKILSSWICAGLYSWTLVAPLIFPDREF